MAAPKRKRAAPFIGRLPRENAWQANYDTDPVNIQCGRVFRPRPGWLTAEGGAAYVHTRSMNVRSFADLLVPLAWTVLIGGWGLAIIAFFVIGTETCTTVDVEVPLSIPIEACTDTTAQSVILLVVVGYVATVGALFLWGLRHLLNVLSEIEEHTQSRR